MIIITGAGPVGSTIARQYADAGTPVRVLTRSGSGPVHPLVERVTVDVNDIDAVRAAADDATVIHHCVHTVYDAKAWDHELPPMERTIMAVAAERDAVVVFPESLYAFDLKQQPVRESTPLAAGLAGKPGVRARLLKARAASEARTISVVASDYFGPGAGTNAHAGDRMIEPAISGKTVRPVGDADQPHSWTYLPDLAAAMIRAADLPAAPDRILMAPTSAPRTQREVAAAYARAAGQDGVKVSPLKPWLLRSIGLLNHDLAEVAEMLHLFTKPQVMDSRHSEALLGLTPTQWEAAIATTVAEAHLPL